MSAVRASLLGVAAAAALTVAGCKDERAVTARSIQSLSPQTVALMTEKGMARTDPILMRIYKEESKAEIWKKRKADGKYALLKSYDICRFSGKLGPKIKEGDKQAPEGFYSVGPGQLNPRSNYYLSFNIGFPNAYDRSLGRTGQHLMVHGDCLSAGCYAMTDAQMAEIYALARESFAGGQKSFQVQALPFRMTPENMARRRNNPNIAFWRNLKEGSDHFEVTKAEPKVDACGKKYVFNATTAPFSTIEPSAGCPSLSVDPQIAKAVAAKKKQDDVLIASLSKAMEPAPEYVAQNGRLRRSLDEPIVQVAAVAPAAASAYAAVAASEPATGSLATSGQAETTKAVKADGPAKTNLSAAGPQLASAAPVVPAAQPAPAPKAEGNLFTRIFRGEEPAAVAAPAAPAPSTLTGPAVQFAAAPAPSKAAKRQLGAQQQPVMAAAVSPPPAVASEPKPASGGIGGWVRSVGGLFGASDEPQPIPTSTTPVEATPASSSMPLPPARSRDRSAAIPEAFKRKTSAIDPRVTSAFAAFD